MKMVMEIELSNFNYYLYIVNCAIWICGGWKSVGNMLNLIFQCIVILFFFIVRTILGGHQVGCVGFEKRRVYFMLCDDYVVDVVVFMMLGCVDVNSPREYPFLF